MRNASKSAISRRAVMKFARSFYVGIVRSRVEDTPTGRWHVIYLFDREGKRRVIGQGVSWETAYMNMRANLPTRTNDQGQSVTDWSALNAQAVRS